MNALSTLAGKARQEKRQTKHKRLLAVAAKRDKGTTENRVRVNGPYMDRDKWRIYLIDASGRKSMLFPSQAEAEAMKAKLTAHALSLTQRTIGESLDDYRDYRVKFRGVLPKTAEDHCRHLRTLLPTDWPISTLTAEKANDLYLHYAERLNQRTGKPISVATHHWVLLIGKCWGRWLVKSGASTSNPFASVEAIGKRNAGKMQLTRDEGRRLSQVAVQRAHAGDRVALGVLLMLHLALRQGEVSARVARDVDNDGRVLIIPFGKTATSKRRLKVPDWLRPFLQLLCADKEPAEPLFLSNRGDMIRGQQFWWCKVRELCKAAAVPLVCPHSLRGLHATLAIEEGASGDAVARALGHTSFEMTAKHYASADSVANARLAKATETLAPQTPQMATDRVGSLLSQLTPNDLAELRTRLVALAPLPSHTSPALVVE